MTAPRVTTSATDALGATIADVKSRLASVELLAHTPCGTGPTSTCPCPENVLITGDTMTGPLVLPGDPTFNLQAATKQYVDAGDSLRVLKSGDTMTGALVLPGNPTLALQAATKQYVDAAVAGSGSAVIRRNLTYLIMEVNP